LNANVLLKAMLMDYCGSVITVTINCTSLFWTQQYRKDFLHFEHFYNSEHLRTCNSCGTVMEADPRFIAQK
jgi:hypothetical protein